MIAKVIHYCWFGGHPLPDKAVRCIESWKKYCPDHEIKCWDETNFDCDCCDYVREAYKEKKWAFVSDYARFKILYENGGLYFDTDVEMIRPIKDLLDKGAFMGCERGERIQVAPGLGLAAGPEMKIYKEILDHYEKEKFLRGDGTYSTKTVVTRVNDIMKKYGFKGNGSIEYIADINIYPPEYFCPKDFFTGKIKVTKNTVSIHHYDATWHEPEEKKSYEIEQYIYRIFGVRLGIFLNIPIRFFYRFKLRVRQKGGVKEALYYFKSRIR